MSQANQSARKNPSRPLHRNPTVVVPTAGILAVLLAIWFFTGFSSASTETGQFYQVRRDDMLISVTEGGTLRAADEVSIVSKLEGEASIIYLIPEGTLAKEGDLLVELDASDLEERLTERQIAYQNALSAFTEARENLAIKKSESESAIQLAELAFEFAEVDLAKYLEGDWPQAEKEAQNAITVAQAELKRAQDRLTYTKDLEEKGYATRTELEADQLDVTRNQLALESAEEALRLLTKYEYPKQVRTLRSDVEQAEAALERARSKASAELAQAEATLNARDATLELDKSRLDRVTMQLENTRIFAPQDGLVVYGTHRQSGEERPMEEGASIHERQEIIKLPDLSNMLVEVKVHESQRSQVKEGQSAFVTIDSMPDRRFRGTVKRVAVLPDSQSRWLNPDLKVYSTEVLIEDDISGVNPGVSARAEIMVSQLEDVIQVPIQAVSTSGGERVVYRSTQGTPEIIPVEIGLFNDSFIEIRAGLFDGDFVLLSPPRSRSNEDRRGAPDSEGDLNAEGDLDGEEAPEIEAESPATVAASEEIKEAPSAANGAGESDLPGERPERPEQNSGEETGRIEDESTGREPATNMGN